MTNEGSIRKPFVLIYQEETEWTDQQFPPPSSLWMSCQQSIAYCVRDYTLHAAAQRHRFLTGTVRPPLHWASDLFSHLTWSPTTTPQAGQQHYFWPLGPMLDMLIIHQWYKLPSCCSISFLCHSLVLHALFLHQHTALQSSMWVLVELYWFTCPLRAEPGICL